MICVCMFVKFSEVKGQGHVSRAVFLLQGASAETTFVVMQAKPWTFQFLTCTTCVGVCVCVLQHTRLSFTPIPTSPSSFTQPPQRCFHIDSSARPVGPRIHRAAAGRDKNRVYFPLKHLSVKRRPKNQRRDGADCQVEPYGAHCYPADEQVLIDSCKGQNSAHTSHQIAEAIVQLCCFF